MNIFSMFDGVGGFIVGLNNANNKIGYDFFKTTDSNQYEPARKQQEAYEVEKYQFPFIDHSNTDITQVPDSYFDKIASKSNNNIIVGGFPCQDYSIARIKKSSKGLEGKKGVLFWEIIRAVRHIQPKYLILENVDRLLKSPSKQKGRDFAIMLSAFDLLGYSVEWRVINASDYGYGQRRKRIYFFVYKNDTDWNKRTIDISDKDYLVSKGLFARQFPILDEPYKNRTHTSRMSKQYTSKNENHYVLDVSDNFKGEFWNTGIMRNGVYTTYDTEPIKIPAKTLRETIQEAKIDYVNKFTNEEQGEIEYAKYLDTFVLSEDKVARFKYLRGAKKIPRTTADGHKWFYSEGSMSEYDSLDKPSRTMLTSEGSPNRSSHVIQYGNSFRTLTPEEAELLQGFPVEWTKYKIDSNGNKKEVSKSIRMFFMGNALVTSIVERIGIELEKIDKEKAH